MDGIVYIKWITDKTSREFYGTTYIEFKDKWSAINAIKLDRSKLAGRPLKIYYCPPKPDDKSWPPGPTNFELGSYPNPNERIKDINNNNNNNSEGMNVLIDEQGIKRKNPFSKNTPKPLNGTKLYIGNLSYDIDDNTIIKFFEPCGELIGLRWLTRKETGEFRGCGYIQFKESSMADLASAKDGEILMGRPIKIDWTT